MTKNQHEFHGLKSIIIIDFGNGLRPDFKRKHQIISGLVDEHQNLVQQIRDIDSKIEVIMTDILPRFNIHFTEFAKEISKRVSQQHEKHFHLKFQISSPG